MVPRQPSQFGGRVTRPGEGARSEGAADLRGNELESGRLEAAGSAEESRGAARGHDYRDPQEAFKISFSSHGLRQLATEPDVEHYQGEEAHVLASSSCGAAYKLYHSDFEQAHGIGIREIRRTVLPGHVPTEIRIQQNINSDALGRQLRYFRQLPGTVPFEAHGTTETGEEVTKTPYLPHRGDAQAVSEWVLSNPVVYVGSHVRVRNCNSGLADNNYVAIGNDGKPYLIADINVKNFRRDANGHPWLVDAIPYPLSDEELAEHPNVAQAVERARQNRAALRGIQPRPFPTKG